MKTDAVQLPRLGMGTWCFGGRTEHDPGNDDAGQIEALQKGIELGFRLIDTAEYYAAGYAESLIGKAIAGFDREKLFITSKVWKTNVSRDGVFRAAEGSLKRLGIEVRFVDAAMSDEEIASHIDENTRLFFGETVANPALTVLDITRFADLAHAHGIPLVVDNTFPTPVLCRPFEFGADIVVHSTTKYMDGHAQVVGGCVVDGGRFDWTKGGKYPELTTPDESYHGIVYTEQFRHNDYFQSALLLEKISSVILYVSFP